MSEPRTPGDVPEDGDYGSPIDNGVEYSDIGSFMPVGSYRPIPIVWMAALVFLLPIGLGFMAAIFSGKPAIVRLAAAALVTGALWYWTYERGMKAASFGWKLASALVALGMWGLVALYVTGSASA